MVRRYGKYDSEVPKATLYRWKKRDKEEREKRKKQKTEHDEMNIPKNENPERNDSNYDDNDDLDEDDDNNEENESDIDSHQETYYDTYEPGYNHTDIEIYYDALEPGCNESESSESNDSILDLILSDYANDNIDDGYDDDANGFDKRLLSQLLLLVATKLKFSLTYKAMEGIAELIKALGGPTIKICNKYYIKKLSDEFTNYLTIHFICFKCTKYIKVFFSSIDKDTIIQCAHCDIELNLKKALDKGYFFIHLSLEKQLQDLLKYREELFKYPTRSQDYSYKDIFDGKMYPRMENLVTINFSLDGAPMFKASNFSMWPVLATINNFNIKERQNNILICSLWFGKVKPDINEFLQPFITEIKKLYKEGLNYVNLFGKSLRKNFRCCAVLSDSVARPMMRGSTQFNGEFGCGFCLHPGVTIEKGGGTVRVYPHPKDNIQYDVRNKKDTIKHALEAEKSNSRIFGMKVRSILLDIPDFDIIWGLDVDYMHCVLLGVCRQFCKLWFDPCNHEQSFYMGKKINVIDEILTSLKPTSEISRTPRKMSDRSHWKAHEWLTWLLVYSLPVMMETFPSELVEHWSLLVEALAILIKKGSMKTEILHAENLLITFIRRTEELYGIEHVSFNVHLLSHLPQSVLNWGPLYAHSAFAFENKNLEIQKFVKSSHGVCLQIYNFYRLKFLNWKLGKICQNDLMPEERAYLAKINNKKLIYALKISDVLLFGKGNVSKLNHVDYLALQRGYVPIKRDQNVKIFKKAMIKHTIFQSRNYMMTKKRMNYVCLTKDGTMFAIEKFVVFTSPDGVKQCFAIGYYYQKQTSLLAQPRKLSHLWKLGPKDDQMASVKASDIVEKVVALKFQYKTIVATWPGFYEMLT